MKITLSTCLTILVLAGIARAETIRVKADSVNLRAASNLSSRVMGQVSTGTVLESIDSSSDWISILPPKDVVLWIHSDLVARNKVKALRAHLRSGPGINYVKMITVPRDTKLNVKGTFGSWTKVAPPPGATVWISRQFTESLTKPDTPTEIQPTPSSLTNTTAVENVHVGIAAKPPRPLKRGQSPLHGAARRDASTPSTPAQLLTSSGITTNMLVKTEAQGVDASLKGILKRASVLWRRPSRYLLIPIESASDDKALCYVAGNDTQLESVLGRKMTVEGKQYTVQGARFPVLTASRITLHGSAQQ